MLAAYEQATLQLFQAATSVVQLIPPAVLDANINSARLQVASEGECIRVEAILNLVAGTPSYNFSSINTTNVAAPTVLAIRSAAISGTSVLDIRGWEWFTAYYRERNDSGVPTIVAQHGQGTGGNLRFFPNPNAAITVTLDAVALPENLIDDTTPEAIPYPWTDAVPFYAAWLCMMNAQRQSDADMMFSRYEQIMMRLARLGATPSQLPANMPMDRGLPQRGGGG